MAWSGIVSLDGLDHGLFGGAIGITDEIITTFLLNVEFFELVHIADEGVSSATSSHYGHIQHCVHGVIPPMLIKSKCRSGPKTGGRIPDL